MVFERSGPRSVPSGDRVCATGLRHVLEAAAGVAAAGPVGALCKKLHWYASCARLHSQVCIVG